MAHLAARTKVGIANESTWGSFVAPKVLYPVEPPTFNPVRARIEDQALRGVPARTFAMYPGQMHTEGTLSGFVYPEEIGFFLLAMLGGYLYTAKNVPGSVWNSRHRFRLSETLPQSLSIQIDDPVQPIGYDGCRPTSLEFRFSAAEGGLTFSCSLTGRDRSFRTAFTPSEAALNRLRMPFPGWSSYFVLGGSGVGGKLVELTITLSRDAEIRYTAAPSATGISFVPGAILLSPLEVTAEATILYTDVADFEKHRLGTQESFRVKLILPGTTEGADGETSIDFLMPRVDYGEGPTEIARDAVALTATWRLRALHDPSIGGPIEVVLLNEYSKSIV